MSAVHHYTIRCDHIDCTNTFFTHDRTASECRQRGAERGWVFTYRRERTRTWPFDLCPVHGGRVETFAPPLEMAEFSCSCVTALEASPCRMHPSESDWRLVAAVAVRVLARPPTVHNDLELDVVMGMGGGRWSEGGWCERPHARVVLDHLLRRD